MNVLVLEKTEQYDAHPMWNRVRERGHTVYAGEMKHCRFTPDAVISWGVTLMDESFEAVDRYRNMRQRAKLFCYNWDVYEWVWTTPRPGEYDYKRYGDLLRKATEIWVPSDCTGRRTTQWYGLTNWRRILSSTPWWEYDKECDGCSGQRGHYVMPNGDHYLNDEPGSTWTGCPSCDASGYVSGVRDDGYALCCLRPIPDPWWGMFEKCCTELGIPYKMTRHELGVEQYRDAIAGCRFICAPLYELSTGGLSLTEAYYHGKPVLLSGSEWNGGRDYLGDRAKYFRHGDEHNFKFMLGWMMDTYANMGTLRVKPDYKEYVRDHLSDGRMGDDVADRLEAYA